MRAKQIPAATREALAARSGGMCECCGRKRAEQAHHRRPRAMGGSRDAATNKLSNLLHLSSECHAWVECHRQDAISRGLLVASWNDPAEVPLLLHGERAVFLNDDCGYRTPEPGELITAAVTLPYPRGTS